MGLRLGIVPVLLLFVCVMFQNCAPAAPPPSSQDLSSSGIYQPPQGGSGGSGATATPTPPPVQNPPSSQTYSWKVGAWSLCSSTSTQSRSVVCVDQNGTQVANSNCTSPMPVASQSCTYKAIFNCQVTYSGGSCDVSCMANIRTYIAQATNPAQCNADPTLIPGAETGTNAAGTRILSRPFSYCIVTSPLSLVPGSTANSQCQ